MMEKSLDTDKKFCSILFDVLQRKGVEEVVCSPGSRNAPLLIAAAAREGLKKHVVVDERSASFMALGIAVVSRRPVALVCTSGTALLNYAPAVAEAFYQGVPLIVVSADRPQQWIDQDDSQTMRQFEALANFVKHSYELPSWGDNDPELLWYANRIANDAVIVATSGKKGPVHINVRLGDPLGHKCENSGKDCRVVDLIASDGIVNREVERNLATELAGKRVLLVAGFLPPDVKLQRAVADFCSLPNVAPMVETVSNLHLKGGACGIDSVLTAYSERELDSMAPEIVISLGGALVSRKLKEYLRRNRGRCVHWSLGWNHTTSDCFMSLTKRIEADPARFLAHLSRVLKSDAGNHGADRSHGYAQLWKEAREKASAVKGKYVGDASWSELKAFDIMLGMLPPKANLFLSNGTAIRYVQILSGKLPHASYCNRGVSGIDGSASTAVGGAISYGGMTVLITGDLSMAYDVGSLSLPGIPDRMKIIVVDNGGGGIFRFIPTTSSLEEREHYFCAPPQLPLRQLADGYGWNYLEAACGRELEDSLHELFDTSGKGILRVVCDGEKSAEVLKGYMDVRVMKN